MSKDYYNTPGINASTLKLFAGDFFDPETAVYQMRNPKPPTQSMALGTAVHSILEHQMDTTEASDVINEAYKTEKSRNDNMRKAHTMARHVWERCEDVVQHPDAIRERSVFKGEFKALMDLEVDNKGYDYKTTRVTTMSECIKECEKWKLDIQAYHYLMLGGFNGFEFIFVSSVAPHPVFRLDCPSDYIMDFARPRWQQALDRYHEFKDMELKEEPDVPVEIPELETGSLSIPGWYQIDASEVNWG